MLKLLGLAFLVFSPAALAANSISSGLISHEVTEDDKVSFECSLNVNGKVLTHRVEVQKSSQQLQIHLHDGVEIKGAAIATRVPNVNKTYYYLTNGFEPFQYKFTVALDDDGSAASFQLVANARILNCKR